ncbi:F-box associated domain, type 1 [Artemisia annua]|uniref:F-box associated domain, type 1 n=1 Tax=Artemisia annua TaxID=35608 RepID=A0A2U1MDP7_ARTAN|nr:F-box associated domain, type 1 [Artemisia annua]
MAKSVKKSSDSERYIPYEIVFMVLAMLPTKLLLQLRSVCKTWRDLISDVRIIKAHLDMANDIHNNSLKRYMDDDVWMRSTGLEDPGRRYQLTVPMKEFSPHVEILASCNGDELRNFALGYDATTKAYKVPSVGADELSPNTTLGPGSSTYLCRYCFTPVILLEHPLSRCQTGFLACFCTNSEHVYDSTTASVYNIKTEEWDRIEHFPYVICGNAQGVTVNGAPHWVMYRDHSANDIVVDPVIVYFDLAEHRFKEILKPHWFDDFCEFEYGVFEGKLCFNHYITKQKTEVWIMEEYGESWVNVKSLVNCVRFPGWCRDQQLGYFGAMTFNEALYVESLVSPFGGDDNSDMIG